MVVRRRRFFPIRQILEERGRLLLGGRFFRHTHPVQHSGELWHRAVIVRLIKLGDLHFGRARYSTQLAQPVAFFRLRLFDRLRFGPFELITAPHRRFLKSRFVLRRREKLVGRCHDLFFFVAGDGGNDALKLVEPAHGFFGIGTRIVCERRFFFLLDLNVRQRISSTLWTGKEIEVRFFDFVRRQGRLKAAQIRFQPTSGFFFGFFRLRQPIERGNLRLFACRLAGGLAEIAEEVLHLRRAVVLARFGNVCLPRHPVERGEFLLIFRCFGSRRGHGELAE